MQEELRLPTEPVTAHPSLPDSRLEAADAADEIYVRHAPLLRQIAIVKFHVPESDAEALVHDVFTSFFAKSVGAVRAPRPYLIGAICNASRHYWRERKTEESALGNADALFSPPSEEGALDAISRKLLIASTLLRIGPKCRDLLRRYYLNSETTASLAADRETSADYILFLLHRCRKRAREAARSLMVL